MKKSLLLMGFLAVCSLSVNAQDFSSVPFNSNGYEIYYSIIDANHVAVTRPASNQPYAIMDTLIDGWLQILDIIIPDSVTFGGHSYCVSAIADSAFANVVISSANSASWGYFSVSLPSSITSIGNYAFANNMVSPSIYMRGVFPPIIGANAFLNTNTWTFVNVPCGSETNYTTLWGMPLFNGIVSNGNSYIDPGHTVYVNDISTREKGFVSYYYESPEMIQEGQVVSSIGIPCGGTSITFSATADSGFHFSHWSNGSTQDTITITLPYTGLLYAYFESNGVYNIVAESDDTTMGHTIGGGQFHYGDTAVLTAVASEHYHFSHWNDGNTENPRQYIVQFQDECFTAFFAPNLYTVTATANDITAGNVVGGGQFAYGTPCTLEATAYSGYHFSQWSNGTTYNPYTFAVVEDVDLTAIFLADGEAGIADIANNGMLFVVRDGKIIVEGANGESVFIYDTEGRLVSNNMLQTGTYFVKVGNHPARKVILIR